MTRLACLLLLGSLAAATTDLKRLEDLLQASGGVGGDGEKELIMLEIEPLPRSHGKRAADPAGGSQALYGASPGQFVVRSGDSVQPEIPPEYLGLLQQLLAQTRSQSGAPQSPVIQQLVVARDPEPSVARFSTTPDPSQFLFVDPSSAPTPPTPATRPPLPPESRVQQQLQQLYHDQRQVPRPPPQPQLTQQLPQQLSPSAALSVHEARLRASLAGDNPDFAAALTPAPTSADFEEALFQQQLQRLAAQAQQEQAQAQAQALQSPAQQVLQRQNVQPQVFPPAPQPTPRQPQYQQQLQVSTPVPRPTTAAPVYIAEPQELVPQRPSPTPQQQYLRETTRPRGRRPQQQLVESPRPTLRQQQLELPSYLSTPTPTAAHDDDVISSLLGQSRRGFFDKSPSTTPTPLPSRSSIFVSTTSTLKNSAGNGITIEELGESPPTGDDSSALPVVRLPTPDGQRPLTATELQALIAAGFKVTPLDGPEESPSLGQSYYQTSAKRQRSYATPVPPVANQAAARQQARKQQPTSQEEKPQRRPQFAYQDDVADQTPPRYQQSSQDSQLAYQPQDLQLVFQQQQRQEEEAKQAVSTQRPPLAYQPQDLQLVFHRQGGEQAQPSSTTQQPQLAYQPDEIQLFFQQQGGQGQSVSSTQQPPAAYRQQDLQLVFQQRPEDTQKQQPDLQLVFQRPEDAQKQQQDLQLVFQRQGDSQQQFDTPVTRLSPIVVPDQEEYATPRRRPAGARRYRQRSRGYRPATSQESDEQSFASYDSEPAPSNQRSRAVRQRSRRPQQTNES